MQSNIESCVAVDRWFVVNVVHEQYSCLRAKNGHLFWNSGHQPIKGIVFELFENLFGKVPLAGDLTIDHRIGDL